MTLAVGAPPAMAFTKPAPSLAVVLQVPSAAEVSFASAGPTLSMALQVPSAASASFTTLTPGLTQGISLEVPTAGMVFSTVAPSLAFDMVAPTATMTFGAAAPTLVTTTPGTIPRFLVTDKGMRLVHATVGERALVEGRYLIKVSDQVWEG